MKKCNVEIIDKTNGVNKDFKNVYIKENNNFLLILDDQMNELFEVYLTQNIFIGISY